MFFYCILRKSKLTVYINRRKLGLRVIERGALLYSHGNQRGSVRLIEIYVLKLLDDIENTLLHQKYNVILAEK